MKCLWTALISLSLLSGCGESVNRNEAVFGSNASSFCLETNRVVDLLLTNHFEKTKDDADELYTNALRQIIGNSAVKDSPQLQSLRSKIFSPSGIATASKLKNCEDLRLIQAYRYQNPLYRGQTGTEESTPIIESSVTSETPFIFRDFIAAFVEQLDLFSRYVPPSKYFADRNFGIRADFNEALFFMTTPDSLKVLSSTLPYNDIRSGDKILEIEFPEDPKASFFSGKDFTIKDFIKTHGAEVLQSILESSLLTKLKVKVLRTRENVSEEKWVTISSVSQRPLHKAFVSTIERQIIYARLYDFMPGVAQEFETLTRTEIEKNRLKYPELDESDFKIVLDLRYNPGGSMDEAKQLADAFLDQGVVARLHTRGKPHQLQVEEPGELFNQPLVIITNFASASAAEVLSQILKESGRAVIVGEQTYGKGIAQTPLSLGGTSSIGGSIWFTIAEITGPHGTSTQIEGVQPSIAVYDPRIEALKQKVSAINLLEGKRSPLTMREMMSNPVLSKKVVMKKPAQDLPTNFESMIKTTAPVTAMTPSNQSIDPQLDVAIKIALSN